MLRVVWTKIPHCIPMSVEGLCILLKNPLAEQSFSVPLVDCLHTWSRITRLRVMSGGHRCAGKHYAAFLYKSKEVHTNKLLKKGPHKTEAAVIEHTPFYRWPTKMQSHDQSQNAFRQMVQKSFMVLDLSRQMKCFQQPCSAKRICPAALDIYDKLKMWIQVLIKKAKLTLLSSFFMVTRSKDFSECPVGAMKYRHAWMRVSW